MEIVVDAVEELRQRERELRSLLPGQGAWMDREGMFLRVGVLDSSGSTKESPGAKRVVIKRMKFRGEGPMLEDVDKLLGAVERYVDSTKEQKPKRRRARKGGLPQGDLFTGEFGGRR